MQSLRTRRPSQSRARASRPANKLTRPPQNQGVGRRATRVDDKIKKRMSMRYADISGPTDASIPAVPTIPLGLRPAGGVAPREQDEAARRMELAKLEEQKQREAEYRMLDQEVFDPDACELTVVPS